MMEREGEGDRKGEGGGRLSERRKQKEEKGGKREGERKNVFLVIQE